MQAQVEEKLAQARELLSRSGPQDDLEDLDKALLLEDIATTYLQLQRLDLAFRPQMFVNHYGSSEVYTFSINLRAVAKPGSAGRAGLNTRLRVVKLDNTDPAWLAAPGEEGQIVADLAGDEAALARGPPASGFWFFRGPRPVGGADPRHLDGDVVDAVLQDHAAQADFFLQQVCRRQGVVAQTQLAHRDVD